MPGKTITYKDATMAMKTVAAYMKDKEKGGTVAKKNTYAQAKAKDPKLDEYIKARDAAKKSGDKSAQNDAQNKINAAYEQGPTDRPVTPKDNKVMQNQQNTKKEADDKKQADAKKKADDVTKVPAGPGKAPEKKPMDKAMEAIAAGDKKAAKESGLKGKLKRVAKRQAGKVKREKKRTEKQESLEKLRSVATRADDTPAMYFKQKIKYNNSAKGVAIRVAADEKDKKHASAKGKKALDHDISSMISHANYGKSMANKYDSMAKMDHGGMAKKVHMKSATMDGGQVSAKDPSAPAKQLKKLGGSVLSKHFKRNR